MDLRLLKKLAFPEAQTPGSGDGPVKKKRGRHTSVAELMQMDDDEDAETSAMILSGISDDIDSVRRQACIDRHCRD